MKIASLLFYAVAGWCVIGLLGTAVSLVRGRRGEAIKHAASLAVVGGAYLLLLLGVSLVQKQRVVAVGQDQCFGDMCFRVSGVDEIPGLVAGSPDRMIRVRIAVANRGHSGDDQRSIEAYVLDSRGRRWESLPGLSGNRLTSHVAAGAEIISQPMFGVPSDARGLGLVLTHGSWQWRQLILGDSDSLAHRPTVVALGK